MRINIKFILKRLKCNTVRKKKSMSLSSNSISKMQINLYKKYLSEISIHDNLVMTFPKAIIM